jgi:hypothetical protein
MEKARREKNVKIFYIMVNTTKQFNPRTSVCKDKEGKMIANKESVLRRWRDHFDVLLNQEIGTNTAYDLEAVPMAQQDEVPDPSLEEMEAAIKKQKINKSPGTDNV